MLPPVKIRLHGDRSLASQYVGHCKSRLLRLEQRRIESNLPTLLERVWLSARITAVLHTTNWGRFIDITASVAGECFMWMDSGLVDVGAGAISAAHPSAYAPGILYLDSGFGTFPRGKIVPDDGGALGFSSSEPGAVNGGPTYAYAITPNEDGATPPDPALPTKKNFTAEAPASMYSGNMRSFVQALHGQKFSSTDVARYSVAAVDGVPAIRLNYGEGGIFTISNATSRSTGIYLDDTYRPWFVAVFPVAGVWQARVIEASLTDCGERVRTELLAAYADVEANKFVDGRNVLVSLMLSQAWPRSGGFDHTFNTGVAASGSALAYGWSFNKLGTQCQIVTHIAAAPSGQNCWAARRYKIDFFRNTELDVSQYPVAQQEQHRWTVAGELLGGPSNWNMRFGGEYIWVPLWGLGQLQLTNYYAPGTTQLGAFSSTTIHVFFPVDSDSICEVNVSATSSGAGSSGRSIDETCWECGGGSMLHPDTQDNDVKLTWSTRGVFSLTVGSISHELDTGTSMTRQTWSITGDVIGPPPAPTYIPTEPGIHPGSGGTGLSVPAVFAYTAPCSGPDNSNYENARAAMLAAVDPLCHFTALSNSFFIAPPIPPATSNNAVAQRPVDTDSGVAQNYDIALVLPMYDCTSVYLFKEQRETGTRSSRVDGHGYVGYRYYAFAYYNRPVSACEFSHFDYYHLAKLNWQCSLDAFTIGSSTVTSINETETEAFAYLGNDTQIELSEEVRDANKFNLMQPSISFPFHNNPFMTRTAANMGGVVGEGILQGGYSVPGEGDISRYFLSYIGFA